MFKACKSMPIRITDCTSDSVWIDVPLENSELVNVVQINVQTEALEEAIAKWRKARQRSLSHA